MLILLDIDCDFDGGQINGKVKLLLGDGKAEDVKVGVEEDPEAEVAIGCPLCGAMFDLRTGEKRFSVVYCCSPDGVQRVEQRMNALTPLFNFSRIRS